MKKQIIRYQSKNDLKKIRELLKITKQQVADCIGYSVRTVERIEQENATTNKEVAMNISKIYGLDYKETFYRVNKTCENELKKILLALIKVEYNPVITKDTYYCLYIRKLDFRNSCVFGKGMWIRDFNRNKEIRVLPPINIENFIKYCPKISIINTEKEWRYWYMGLTVGTIYKVIVSEKCMRHCLGNCLKETIVKKDELYDFDEQTDMMFLGTK